MKEKIQNAKDINREESLDLDLSGLEPWKEVLFSFMGELLGERLRKKISQQELADRMKVSQSVISRFEHAGRIPTFEFLYRVSEALGMKLLITPFGERTIILSQKQMETIRDHITEDKPDIYSVVSEMIDKCIDDNEYECSDEDTDSGYTCSFPFEAQEEILPQAACTYSMEKV